MAGVIKWFEEVLGKDREPVVDGQEQERQSIIDIIPANSDSFLYLLEKIDEGRQVSERTMKFIKQVDSISWRKESGRLPYCVYLMESLTYLDLSYTQFDDLSQLNGLKSLKELNLDSAQINNLSDISEIHSLTNLNLRSTSVTDLSALRDMRSLETLSLRDTRVRDIGPLSSLKSLKKLDIRNTLVADLEPLRKLKMLNYLDLRNSAISSLNSISELKSMYYLNIDSTCVSDLTPISNLYSMLELRMWRTAVTDLTPLSKLHLLNRLDLSGLVIDELPEFLLDLNISFVSERFFEGNGINIFHLKINKQDINIFLTNNRELIREYFRQQKKGISTKFIGISPLNEVKVVFLGDGGAGKTLAIERLLHDGEKPENFDGESTPGISINSKTYRIGEDDIEVHFWDFGGQEILHSMHRLFLTQRTLYVVFLNARDNKQDDQAWYWLNNIRSFAKDAPALIILNQMDQNPSAALNETGLRDFYPALVKEIQKISALNDSAEEFNVRVTETVRQAIDAMGSVRVSFPNQWKRLMDDIQGMEDNYIQADTFRKKCAEQGIEIEKDIFDSLISLFQDTGVCFCSRKNAFQGDYMVLKPEWLTNALYILAFNGRKYARNGILTEKDCFELFKEKVVGEEEVKKVREDITYKSVEIRYILDVVQNFGLLYRIDQDRFFMPMLCDPDERDVAKTFLEGGDSLHTSFEYEYLPANVMHRLMVRFGQDIRMDQVWRTGAVFEMAECGWRALVCIRQNKLEMYVKAENENIYTGASYRQMLSNAVSEINSGFGLTAEELVYYRWRGKEEPFELEVLEGSFNDGIDVVYSKLRKGRVNIKDILTAYTVRPEASEQEVLRKALCAALLKLQSNHDYLKENNYNARVRDLMEMREKYNCFDERREGFSENWIESGELDIMIRDIKSNSDLAIYEGLRLKDFGEAAKTYLDRHLNKLLDNYNAKGLRYLYLVSYVSWSKENFAASADDYYEYVLNDSNSKYPVTGIKTLGIESGQFIRCWEVNYDCGGTPLTVFHFVVRMGK